MQELGFELLASGPRFELRHGDRPLGSFPQADLALLNLELFVADFVLASIAGPTRLHAGCATVGGRRVLVSGADGSGKTALLLRLLLGGAAVHADEISLLDGRDVQPFPKKFVLFDGAFTVTPEILPLCRGLHRFALAQGEGVRLFDPVDAGRPWTLPRGPVEHVFFLEPDFGGPGAVEPCTKTEMIRRLVTQTLNADEDTGRRLRDLSAVVAEARCHRVVVGDAGETAAAVLRTLS